jgi:hypothetical protein
MMRRRGCKLPSAPIGGAVYLRRFSSGASFELEILSSGTPQSPRWTTRSLDDSPIQLERAYLLMTIIAVLLVIGSHQGNPLKWNVVGALAHCPPLTAALSSLNVFESIGALGMVRFAIAFHVVWFGLESFAALYPNPRH